ncbi:MAG: hexose kinase [Clostridia bacterium]|nr:hexose kinase [Clostridia bacterium]
MITTLTLSPAFDVHVTIGEFRAGRENLAESVRRDVGGKGINISRALSAGGVDNRPLVVVGSANGREFLDGLRTVGLACDVIEQTGSIRENITIHPASGDETRLSFKGFTCTPDLLEQVKFCLAVKPGDIVTFTGSLPGGICADAAEAFLIGLRDAGARLVIDSKSVTLDMLRRIKPWLIKPNAEEIESYFGAMNETRLYHTAARLHEDGIENVMISLGGDGAILAAEGVWRARVPKLDALSTIGAGDSAIAGFIAAEGDGDERLRRAVAYGSAACLREGTNPPLPEDIARIYEAISIERID